LYSLEKCSTVSKTETIKRTNRKIKDDWI